LGPLRVKNWGGDVSALGPKKVEQKEFFESGVKKKKDYENTDTLEGLAT